MAIITVSRQFGSGGEIIAEVLSEAAGFILLNKKSLHDYIAQHHIPEIRLEWINEISPSDIEGLEAERMIYINSLKKIISDLSQSNDVILLGRGGQFLFKGCQDAVHIKVVAELETRAAQIQKRFKVDKAGALSLIKEKDMERTDYALFFHRGDWMDPEVYDLTINTTRTSISQAVEIVLTFLRQKGIIQENRSAEVLEKALSLAGEKEISGFEHQSRKEGEDRETEFANKSEEEFARILDYYKIKYLYEPTTFPLKWDSEGNIESAFTPDFYFPDFDLYIELTTMKQELVTKKNRKLKELKKLYPDVNIKLFYRKDYRKLLEKFGINPESHI